jgi:hypothetical protein
VPGDVRAAGRLESWDEVRALVADTPAAAVPLPTHGAPPSLALSRRQYVNVAMVGLFARFLQILLLGLAVRLFLVLLGVLALTEAPRDVLAPGCAFRRRRGPGQGPPERVQQERNGCNRPLQGLATPGCRHCCRQPR